MRVLTINGSPHLKGNTAAALTMVEEELERLGVEVERFDLGVRPVQACSGCGRCKSNGYHCILDRDGTLTEVQLRMRDADALVVGSPVYYASPTGSLLSFLDRFFYSINPEWVILKPYASVAVARRAGSVATFDVLNKYGTISQMPVVSSCYWNDVFGLAPGEAEKDPEGAKIMRQLARNMHWMLSCIEAGRAAGVENPESPLPVHYNFIR